MSSSYTSRFISSALKSGNFERAWKFFRSPENNAQNIPLQRLMIQYCGSNSLSPQLAALWLDAVDGKIVPNIDIFNDFIRAFVDAGNITKATEVLRTLSCGDVKPNGTSLAILMEFHNRRLELARSKVLMNQVLSESLQPTPEYLAAAIRLKSLQRDFSGAEKIFNGMRARGVEKTLDVDCALLFCRAISGDEQEVFRYLTCAHTRDQGAKAVMSQDIYAAAIEGFGQRGETSVVRKLAQLAAGHKIPRNFRLLKALLSAHSVGGSLKECLQVASALKGCQMTQAQIRSVDELTVTARARFGRIDDAVDEFKKRTPHSTLAAKEILKHFARRNKEAKLLEWFKHVKSTRVRLDEDIYAIVIRAYAVSGGPEGVRLAEKMRDEMRTLGISSSVVILNALLHGYAYSGNYEKARNEVRMDLEQGIRPNRATLSLLLEAYANSRDKHDFQSLLSKLRDDQRNATETDFEKLLTALQSSGGTLVDMLAVIQEMQVQQTPISETIALKVLVLFALSNNFDDLGSFASIARKEHGLELGFDAALAVMDALLDAGKRELIPASYQKMECSDPGLVAGKKDMHLEGLFLAASLSGNLSEAYSAITELKDLRKETGGRYHERTAAVLKLLAKHGVGGHAWPEV